MKTEARLDCSCILMSMPSITSLSPFFSFSCFSARETCSKSKASYTVYMFFKLTCLVVGQYLFFVLQVRLYRDFISLLPKPLSIKILSYLSPQDLLLVAKVSYLHWHDHRLLSTHIIVTTHTDFIAGGYLTGQVTGLCGKSLHTLYLVVT